MPAAAPLVPGTAALAAGGADALYPGPGPWDARAWTGAGLYVLLFAVALWGVWRLCREAPGEEAGR